MATGDDDDDDVHGMQRLCPARVPPVSRPCPARVRQTKASHKPTPEAMYYYYYYHYYYYYNYYY